MIDKVLGDRALVLGAVGIFASSLAVSGYLLGDGLRRAKEAEREVAVRGVSERDVTADLATWSISVSHADPDFAAAQQSVDRQVRDVRSFLVAAGLNARDVTDTEVSLDREKPAYDDKGPEKFVVSRTVQLRTRAVMAARAAYGRQAELLGSGVELAGSTIAYTFTGLNALKPGMIAEANHNARANAEQFARDSGATVGRIKSASQGYFSVGARDGEDCDDCSSGGGSSPFQKVRVVTTIYYDLV